jgi:hypothetical protein
MLSIVLIITAALRADANALGEAMGWGPDNYSVPLTDGDAITHYGLHTWATQAFVDMVEARALPDDLTHLAPVLDALIMSVRDASEGHFAGVIAAHGLSMEAAA